MPPSCDPHATLMRPSCDPHATLMRPSCDPQATPKPPTITQFFVQELVSVSAGRFSPKRPRAGRPSPSGPDIPEECQQDDANRGAAQHSPEHWVPAVILRQPPQTLALDHPSDVAEEPQEPDHRQSRQEPHARIVSTHQPGRRREPEQGRKPRITARAVPGGT